MAPCRSPNMKRMRRLDNGASWQMRLQVQFMFPK